MMLHEITWFDLLLLIIYYYFFILLLSHHQASTFLEIPLHFVLLSLCVALMFHLKTVLQLLRLLLFVLGLCCLGLLKTTRVATV